jgi:hypothetical protein
MRILLQETKTNKTFTYEPDSSVVPRVGEKIIWNSETYKVRGVLHDIEDGIVVVDVDLSGESLRARMDAQSPPP